MKRLVIALLFLLCVSRESSAQVGILAFPAEATPAGADFLYLVKTPGGAATDRHTTATNLTKALAPASATAQGVVTTGVQTFAGNKTFSGTAIVNGNLSIDSAVYSAAYAAPLNFNNSKFLIGKADGTQTYGVEVRPLISSAIGHIITLAATPTANAFEINSSAGSGGDLAVIAATGNATFKGSENSGNIVGRVRLGTTDSGIWNTGGGSVVLSANGAQSLLITANGMQHYSDRLVRWANAVDSGGELSGATLDTGLARNAAGIVEVNNGTAGTFRDLKARNIETTGTVIVGGGTAITKVLSATATLDFPDTILSTVADLTMTVTGASLGDVVDLGVPHGSTTASSIFTGWVSAADTVTVRFAHIVAGNENPASGTFLAMVTKF